MTQTRGTITRGVGTLWAWSRDNTSRWTIFPRSANERIGIFDTLPKRTIIASLAVTCSKTCRVVFAVLAGSTLSGSALPSHASFTRYAHSSTMSGQAPRLRTYCFSSTYISYIANLSLCLYSRGCTDEASGAIETLRYSSVSN
jgi:hypothetical protein